MTIDVDKLRSYLIDYYGTAAFSGMPMALVDLSKVQSCSVEDLVQIALKERVDLSQFAVAEDHKSK